jgi:hypothetical protein
MGSAGNFPTEEGMREQARWLREFKEAVLLPRFVIVGSQTDALREEMPNNVSVKGFLSDIELEDVLVNAKCLWVHQPPTSGQLNRIYEAILIGLPVVANRSAARGFEGCRGVSVYEHLEQLPALLMRTDYELPNAREFDLYLEIARKKIQDAAIECQSPTRISSRTSRPLG